MRERLRGGLDTLGDGPRDRPERHRALRNTIAWSYRLLTADEQRLFARLSVFQGPRTLEAVRAVCMEGLGIDVLAGIASLVDKSIVQRRIASDGEVTLVLLELLAEFAKEVLAGSADADAVRRRHAAYFADLAERADTGMLGSDAQRWERLLNSHLEDLRAALGWAFAGGDVRLGIRIAAALHLFWYWGGPHEDGPLWVRLAMERNDELDDATRGRLHVAAGFFGFADSDMVTARRHWETALAAYRRTGDDLRACLALSHVAVSYAGDAEARDRAMRLADEAVTLARNVPDYSRPLAEALTGKGEIARLAGDGAAATACYREALAIAQAMGDDGYVADLQSNLAYVAVRQGDFLTALELTRTGLEVSWKLGKPIRLAWGVGEVAGPELALGRPERAARLLGAADAALDRMRVSWQPVDQPKHDRTLAGLKQVLGRDRLEALLDEGAQMSLDEAVDYALTDSDPPWTAKLGWQTTAVVD